MNRLEKYVKSESFRRHQAAKQRATVGGGIKITMLNWANLVHLFKSSTIVGDVIGNGRVSKLVFEYPDGSKIEVPADCKMVAIHLE